MHPALFKLIRLLVRARLRRLVRGVRTPKGMAYTVVALGLMAVWIGPTMVVGWIHPRGDSQAVRDYVPIVGPILTFAAFLGAVWFAFRRRVGDNWNEAVSGWRSR